jgi:acyl-CoA thioesterase-1
MYFAAGESLYAGGALLALAIVGPLFSQGFWTVRLSRVAFWMGVAMTVMATPPISWIAIAGLALLLAMWIILSNIGPRAPEVLRKGVSFVLLLGLAWLLGSELFHRKMPYISGVIDDHLVVIGDSISSGVDARSSWPSAMQQFHGIKTKNLARAGAQAGDGRDMAREVKPEDHVVLVELGGNDLLSGNTSQQFSDGLNATLAALIRPGRIVVMLELPLLPQKIAYGQIQRRLAAEYGAYLIPKKYFTDVISGSDATTDGLHLSNKGSRCMAILIAHALSHVLSGGSRLQQS